MENLKFYCLGTVLSKLTKFLLVYLPQDCLIYMSTRLLNPNTHWGKRRENLVSELPSTKERVNQARKLFPKSHPSTAMVTLLFSAAGVSVAGIQ